MIIPFLKETLEDEKNKLMFGKPGQYREEYIRGTGDTLNWFINLKANLRSSIEREKEIEKGQNNG